MTLCAPIVLAIGTLLPAYDREDFRHLDFYVPENPRYTIVDSVRDSLRFTVEKTLRRTDAGHIASISSFVDPDGAVMDWHDFGTLEGPGWAANAAGGAHEIFGWGRFLGRDDWTSTALGILDHVLEGGFIDNDTGFIHPYRDVKSGKLCLNYKHNSDWLCPGSMAKIAFQLLSFAADLGQDPRAATMRQTALRCAQWLDKQLAVAPNGWYPRRCTASGEVYAKSPEGGNDAFWQTSADGLFIVQLHTALTAAGLADYKQRVREKCDVFVKADGMFASMNHDTYDPNENVAYSVAFRTLLAASRLLDDPALREFAYRRCLHGLERFKMHEDRNGVATKGLLYMERTWNTSYMWENAEAALAYFEAALDTLPADSQLSREYEVDGLTILRAAAAHHYGPHGFLTEGVDWDNIVGEKHHVGEAFYAAIRYTEPFLNNQHIAEPTLLYLKRLAAFSPAASSLDWRDLEGNVILRLPAPVK